MLDATTTPLPTEMDPDLPTFEVWVNGRRFCSTQVPGLAFRMLHAIRDGRPALVPPELRVVNDRRTTERTN